MAEIFLTVLVIIWPKDERNLIWFTSVRDFVQPPKLHLFIHNYGNYATIMLKFSMDQFCILRNHGVIFNENQITFNPCPRITSPLHIHVYAYKCLKNIGIVMKFSMNVYFVNLNHITKICYGRFIIVATFKTGPLKKICLAIIICLKILLPR